MRESLRVTHEMLVLDLGEAAHLVTQDGRRLARYIAVLREPATRVRLGQRPMGPGLMRKGLPPSETLVYTLPADPLEFEWDGSTLVLPGFRFYLEGAPEFPETPYYVWREEGYA